MIRVKKILYPTDFSSYSTHAYFHADGLAETFTQLLCEPTGQQIHAATGRKTDDEFDRAVRVFVLRLGW